MIFEWCRGGNGEPPLGIDKIVTRLGQRRVKRRSSSFRAATAYLILHREIRTGTHCYNRTSSREGAQRPREEWIAVAAPRPFYWRSSSRFGRTLRLGSRR